MPQINDYVRLESELLALQKGMRRGNAEYDSLRKLLKKNKVSERMNLTTYWRWKTNPDDEAESYFYTTPPISRANDSNRVLVIGTKAEVGGLSKIIDGYLKDPTSQSQSKVIAKLPKLIEGIVEPKFTYTASVGSFWENFFGQEYFLDARDNVSVPRAMLATGMMRASSQHGNYTVAASERLKEIAANWAIPITFVKY